MVMDLTEFLWQTTSFSEEDIKMLVKQFRMDFPTGNVNKQGAQDVIHRVFPRYSRTNSCALQKSSTPFRPVISADMMPTVF